MNDSIKIGIIGSDKYNYLDVKIIVFLNMKNERILIDCRMIEYIYGES